MEAMLEAVGGGVPTADTAPAVRLLLAEDDDLLRRVFARAFRDDGYEVEVAADGEAALTLLREKKFDAILTDISMPRVSGIDLLRAVREHDADVPIVLMTGGPELATALQAIEHGAFRYLVKPVELSELRSVVRRAASFYRLAQLKREALAVLGDGALKDDRQSLDRTFRRALDGLWMAFQPIVSWADRSVFGYEALVRTAEPALARPPDLIGAAERLRRLPELGRAVREAVALHMQKASGSIFVNLHAADLLDEHLLDPQSSLSAHASRVVLEITERAGLDEVKDARARIESLKRMGYRIAVDDLGAGYAGLNSFAQLEPQIVKLDMALVRGVDQAPTKRKLVQSIVALCRDLGIVSVAEGVETASERDTLAELGCDLLQGYLFAKPERGFPLPRF
jgi:EAL domain-containing protein (putative c-di-GMP-specific phosphodiesterase class I)/ActR/RegA family two-component response regulator